MEQRRRAPRQEANLDGLFRLEGDPPNIGWRECCILDLSELGIGITFHDLRQCDLNGRVLLVELPSAQADRLANRVKGEIKNVLVVQPGIVRAGIELEQSHVVSPAVELLRVLENVNEVEAVNSFE